MAPCAKSANTSSPPGSDRLPVKRLPLFLALAAPLIAAPEATAPAKNWVLPLFNKDGQRTMTARGSEARIAPGNRVEVADLNLTVFSATIPNQVETSILAPAATFLPDESLARGERTVRFIRDDLEATGTRWAYDHASKKVSLDGQVRIVINAQLKDLLK